MACHHNTASLRRVACLPAPGLAFRTAPLPCNAVPYGIPSFLGLTTEVSAGGVSQVPVGSPS